MENKTNRLKNFTKAFIKENPLFVMILGTCPALATTKSIESALGMGILFILVLIGSNVFISLLKKLIPEDIKIPSYIVVIATFVTIVKMLCQAFLPELYSTLGVFISLIVVNCIVLGRAEAYASKNSVFDSFIDAISNGLGYTFALLIMAAIREILGTGGISMGTILTFIPKFSFLPLNDYALKIFQMPTGAFITFAIILTIIGFSNNLKNEKAQYEAKKQKELETSKGAN